VLGAGIDSVVDKLTGSGSLGGLIYDLVNGTEDWTASTNLANTALATGASQMDESARKAALYAEEIARLEAEYGRIADGALAFYSSVDEALEAATDGQRVFFNETIGLWVTAAAGPEGYADAIEGVGQSAQTLDDTLADFYRSQGLEWDSSTGQVKAFGESFGEAAGSVESLDSAIESAATTTRAYGSETGGTLSVIGSQFAEAGDAAKAAFEQTDAYFLKLMELASNEKIALIEAHVAINVAEIEADTRRVEAAFESINNAITESYSSLDTLYGMFLGADSYFDQHTIESWIKEEQARLDAQLEMQRQLIEAEISLIYARTDALDRGDGLIQIDGAGLQPHLEAFMWEILRAIQVRVNEDGLDMLLGVET
jgi:hypothetical protein